MKAEEVKKLSIDKKYRFYFKNGKLIERNGSYLLQTKNGIYEIDTHKLSQIYKIEEVDNDNNKNTIQQ